VDRRVHMGRGMEDRGDLVRHHPLLGMVGDALEPDLLVTGKDRRIHAPAMAELVELKPGMRIDHRRHGRLLAWTGSDITKSTAVGWGERQKGVYARLR